MEMNILCRASKCPISVVLKKWLTLSSARTLR